jgi:hypothetical protein
MVVGQEEPRDGQGEKWNKNQFLLIERFTIPLRDTKN